jgi:DNA replication protein DnaC
MAMVSTETPACRSCGQALPAEPVFLLGRKFVFGPTVCSACSLKPSEERKEQSTWQRLCPKLYRVTDVIRLEAELRQRGYDVQWLQEILGWTYGPQGLMVSGPTGVGKSRVMWLLLRQLLDTEQRVGVILNSVRFRTGLQAAARDCATERFVHRLVRAEVLYWDDLGQTHLTGAASEMLLHVLEERTSTGMPILATTQYSGEGIDAQFERKETGQAVRRRLNEFCKVVVVREQHVSKHLCSSEM